MTRLPYAGLVTRTLLALAVALVLAACGGSAPTPKQTPEPTESLEDRIATYARTWGGQETQYEIILTLDECENLGRLGLAQMEKLEEHDADGPASTEWRQANGYLGAILERIEEIDCPESISVP